MKLVVDVSEPENIKILLRQNNIDYVEERLSTGDYLAGKYLVERSQLQDFLNKLNKGTMYYQIKALSQSIKDGFKPILVIEGNIPYLIKETSRIWHQVYGAILGYYEMGIMSIIVHNTSELVALLRLMLGKSDSMAPQRPRAVPFQKAKSRLSKMEIKEDMLRSIPSIGLTKAKLLLKKYPIIASIPQVPLADLEKLIGKTSAHMLLEILTT